MGGPPPSNSDKVFIALAVILYFPISPLVLIFGLAIRALGELLLLCNFRKWSLHETAVAGRGFLTLSALAFIGGPFLILLLPIYVIFLGCNTLAVFWYQARGKEPPLFCQKNEWRGRRRQGWREGESAETDSSRTSLECERNDTSYQYESLRREHDIRILTIHPGSPGDPLDVSLRLANLTHHPLYDALSYTWADESGDARRSVPVVVQSSAGPSVGTPGLPIFVTPNCAAAMRRLRLRDTARPVWIDAVCIDQSADVERSHQVSLMARIYTQARQVVVYTGGATPSSDRLFAWLDGLDGRSLDFSVLMRQLQLLTPFQEIDSAVATAVPLLRLATGGNMASYLTDPSAVKSNVSISAPELQELVRDFVSRRWFSRVWVVQEFALADVRNTVVLAGDKKVSAVRVMHAISLLQSDHYGATVEGNDAMDIFVLLARGALGQHYGSGDRERKTSSHLLDMLIATRAHASVDPRDKIFGVLSIAREWDGAGPSGHFGSYPQQLPAADYALSTREVFTRYSAFFIREHGVGFFLSLIKSTSEVQGLPSWAADWTVPWPNMKAVSTGQKDVVAIARARRNDEPGDGRVIAGDDQELVLMLCRPRILFGFFTREGHLDGAANPLQTSHIESVGDLQADCVLAEVHPGLALLLQQESGAGGDYYIFIRACPWAPTQEALKDVVSQWSSVVLGIKSPAAGSVTEHLYLSERHVFRIH